MFYDDNRRWICINGYNGYEYSNDGLLRSMKNFKVNPTGKLLKKYKNKKGYYYILSDNNNQRKKVYEQEIIDIINSDKVPRIRRTYETDIDARNRIFTKPRTSKQKINLNKYVGIPKFTIIDKEEPKIIEPLIFIKEDKNV